MNSYMMNDSENAKNQGKTPTGGSSVQRPEDPIITAAKIIAAAITSSGVPAQFLLPTDPAPDAATIAANAVANHLQASSHLYSGDDTAQWGMPKSEEPTFNRSEVQKMLELGLASTDPAQKDWAMRHIADLLGFSWATDSPVIVDDFTRRIDG